MQVQIYCCPTYGCGNFYGSSSMGDMTRMQGTTDGNYTPRSEEAHFRRLECPDCRARGDKVNRVACTIDVTAAEELVAHPAE